MAKRGLKKIEIQNYKPLGEVVFDYLKNAILNGDLKPGERLMEIALAEQLGVSRTPVREAIRKLELENFIEMVPRKGAYVAEVKAKDILDILEIRALLEGFAAGSAAEKMTTDEVKQLSVALDKFEKAIIKEDRQAMIESDNKFHDLIFQASKNKKLIEIVNSLQDQFQRFRVIYFNEFDNYTDLQSSHRDIHKAILERNFEDARTNAENHVNLVKASVLKWKNEESKEK